MIPLVALITLLSNSVCPSFLSENTILRHCYWFRKYSMSKNTRCVTNGKIGSFEGN